MKIEQLLESAKALPTISKTASDEYEKKSEVLISAINSMMLKRDDLDNLLGGHIEMMKDNHANHVRFMSSMFKFYQADVMVETVLWVFRAYRTHGFKSNYWSTQLNYWTEILKEELSQESFKEIDTYYHWMIINIPVFVKLADEQLEDSNRLT